MEKKKFHIPQRKKMSEDGFAPQPADTENLSLQEDIVVENQEDAEPVSENRRIAEDAPSEFEEDLEALDKVEISESQRNDILSPTSFFRPTEEPSELRLSFVQPLIKYFKTLEDKLIEELSSPEDYDAENFDEEEFPDIVAEDKLQYDEQSINAAMVLCGQLDTYLKTKISNTEFQEIQSIYLFYESSEQLLDMIKLLFIGDLVTKEKVARIYGSKVFGTFKVIQLILETEELFEGMDETEKNEARTALQKYAEDPLRRFKKFFLAPEQVQIPDTGSGLADGVRKTLSMKDPLFDKNHDYNLILENFREFILCLYANPFVLQYVQWKDKYMRHWLFQELFRLDLQNMESQEIKMPQYTLLKCKVYQQLETVFSNLDRADRLFDTSLNLKKTHYRALGQGEAFLSDADEADRSALEKAREAEKALLDSLNVAQIANIAEKVHMEIAQVRRHKKLKGKTSANANMRSVDIGSEKKAEEKYMAATVKVQVTQAKQRKDTPAPDFFKAMGKLARKLNLLQKKTAPADEPTVEEKPSKPETIPRAQGNTEGPLQKAEVDWAGYGREFKSTIYERTYPNLQQRFFEHGGLQLRLNQDFQMLVDTLLQYYGDLDYIKKVEHKIGVSSESGDGIKAFVDEAIYLCIENDMFLALGRAPFSKSAEPVAYVQIYRTNPTRVQKGTMKNVDFSKTVNDVKYELEHIENANELRPLLFRSLIKVIDSLPDDLRDQQQSMLKGMYRYLENEEAK